MKDPLTPQADASIREYLTRRELAARAGVSPLTIHRYKKAGKIPCHQPGGEVAHVFYPLNAIHGVDELQIRKTWERYLAHVGRPDVLGGAGPQTQKRYRAVRDKHQAFCERRGVLTWGNVDQKHVEAYGAHLAKEGYGDATIYLE